MMMCTINLSVLWVGSAGQRDSQLCTLALLAQRMCVHRIQDAAFIIMPCVTCEAPFSEDDDDIQHVPDTTPGMIHHHN